MGRWLVKLALRPWPLFVMIVAGWINRQQQPMVDYLRAEIRFSARSSADAGFCSTIGSGDCWQ